MRVSRCSISDPFARHTTAALGRPSSAEATPQNQAKSALPTGAFSFSMNWRSFRAGYSTCSANPSRTATCASVARERPRSFPRL